MARSDIPWPTVGKLVAALVAAGVLTAGLLLPYVGGLGLAARHESQKFLDTSCNLQETQPPEPSTIYASDGTTVIARIFTQDRQPVPLTAVPKELVNALVATEDRRFYSHHGVDMRGLLRSAVSNANGDTQGGSTLTMQYVKQIRYYQAGKDVAKQQAAVVQNLNRKIEDAKCAIFIESKESKDTILDNYLNIAFFGENSYGIQTAAENYFNKSAKDLTLPESAMLVGLLRAPSEYDPYQNPTAALQRRNDVLQNLVDVGDLSQSQADQYKATPVRLATTSQPVVREGCANANTQIQNVGFFCDYVTSWLSGTQGITDLDTGGYKIVTTLNAGLQNTAQSHLWQAFPPSAAMTAVVPAVDPKTGNVVAMVTSKQYGNPATPSDTTHTVLHNFTNYTASGASTYKLFSLLTALQTGVPANWSIATNTDGKGYKPSTCFDGGGSPIVTNGDANESYSITETLSSATAKSSNTFYVGMDDALFQCNLQPIVDMALKLGLNGLKQPFASGSTETLAQSIVNNQYVLPLALGSGIGTSPLELAGAYAAIANGGTFNTPAPVVSITDVKNQPVSVKRTPAVQVVSPQIAAQAVNILAGDTTGAGTSARPFESWYNDNSSVIAGKTGTAVTASGTQNSALWFVGVTPTLVATTAVINPSGPSNPIPSLPGVNNPAATAYGAYASQLWLSTFAPTLSTQHWSWPSSDSSSFGDDVPSVVGMDVASAQRTLLAAGFTMAPLAANLSCASTLTAGLVAYAGPQVAPKGTTITFCPSSGVPAPTYTPPVRVPVTSVTPGAPIGGRTTITVPNNPATAPRPSVPSVPRPSISIPPIPSH